MRRREIRDHLTLQLIAVYSTLHLNAQAKEAVEP
jgi:hypothetical protein